MTDFLILFEILLRGSGACPSFLVKLVRFGGDSPAVLDLRNARGSSSGFPFTQKVRISPLPLIGIMPATHFPRSQVMSYIRIQQRKEK
jgi:hypothetical protein